MNDTNADQPLIVVFHAEVPELLPLAEGVLQQEGIEYLVQRAQARACRSVSAIRLSSAAQRGAADICVNADDAGKGAQPVG